METLLAGTAELVRRSLQIDVQLEFPPGNGGELEAQVDANQLQQVLVNLALNSRDALTQPAPVIFRLRPALRTADLAAFPQNVPAGDYVVLEVEDQGKGMSAAVLNQALDPFFTTKEVGQGTGLGLPVAFGIIQGHQGYLTIVSQPDAGTCVSLYLPRLTAREAGPPRRFEPATVLEPENAPGRHILVVDDEEAVLDVVRRFLEIAGHTVTSATSAANALDLLKKDLRVELIILDLMIPREDGLENFQALRRHYPTIPILLCTGMLQAEHAPRLLEERDVDLIRKPFRMNELWYAVNKALGQAGT
jgi:two-component system cell cycle sensor histidine kinase/response regulator CckA